MGRVTSVSNKETSADQQQSQQTYTAPYRLAKTRNGRIVKRTEHKSSAITAIASNAAKVAKNLGWLALGAIPAAAGYSFECMEIAGNLTWDDEAKVRNATGLYTNQYTNPPPLGHYHGWWVQDGCRYNDTNDDSQPCIPSANRFSCRANLSYYVSAGVAVGLALVATTTTAALAGTCIAYHRLKHQFAKLQDDSGFENVPPLDTGLDDPRPGPPSILATPANEQSPLVK